MSRELTRLTDQLHKGGALKVWSLIITFFGDSIVNRGGNVAAVTVQTVFDRINIGDGAVRTAFSRLAADGWVEREKHGRRSYYQLSHQGSTPFTLAAERIYSPVTPLASEQCDVWLLGVHPEKQQLADLPIADAVRLPNRSVLILNPNKAAENVLNERGFLSVTGDCSQVPDWVVQHLCPQDWEQQVTSLQKSFAKLAVRSPSDPLTALAARTLLVHQWRRLLLRYPPVPAVLKGHSLIIENECREFVGQLYQQLTGPAEAWLNENGMTVNGHLPEAKTELTHRFTSRYLD